MSSSTTTSPVLTGRLASTAPAPGEPSTRGGSPGAVPGERVVVVGTHPPTQCGLATYTAHLATAIADGPVDVDVIRLTDEIAPKPSGVVFDWHRDRPSDTLAAAAVANHYDAIVVQHEFGIFPGQDGDEVVRFLARCRRPVITVLHTVLSEPSASQRRIMEAVLRDSAVLVVHTEIARVRLLATFDVAPLRVAVVPHGAAVDGARGRELAAAPGMPTVLTWGLLGPGKGIETGIAAVARMRRSGFDVRYVVAGELHPNVRRSSGERYRDELVDLAHRLGVSDLVTFDAEYRDDAALRSLVRSADLVLLPYDSTEQVTSGVLVEALAAGRPVVATAFPHAIEASACGAIHLVRQRSPERCAAAIHAILSRPHRHGAMAEAARREGRRYDWAAVAGRFRTLILGEICAARSPLGYVG
jgi:glycosyltransferase involved in cell wall biosynthesis